jgi:hypothetical protein
LRRRDIEQAVIAPAEIIGGGRRRIAQRLLLEARIGVERMLLALVFLGVGKLVTASDYFVLRLDVRGIRSGRLRGALRGSATEPSSGAADLQARREALQIALLLVGEVDGEGFDFHVQRRSSCCHCRGSTGNGF